MEDIKEIKITHKDYPALLKNLSDAPKVLYCKGDISILKEKCFAIVGTRHPSSYGQDTALQFADQLSQTGLVIVSGMAPGIDTFAHQMCVEKNRKTVAVLGTGLDKKSIYPQTNVALSKKIIENGGCLISELPIGTRGSKFTFPRRNRIVVALSLGVLVVEAKERSGSLITARLANEQHKKLFAIPGPINSLNSFGPNRLIKEGAILTQSPEDILQQLQILPGQKPMRLPAENKTEQLILETLLQETLYIDTIIKKTHLSPSEVAASLALMELSGKIRNLGANVYSIN